MKMTKPDELFEIFNRKLGLADPEKQTSEEVITETVEEYLERLLLRGHIPMFFIENIQEDLVEEVKTMFKKKTYGYFDLKSYKKAKTTPSKGRSKSKSS
jgi:hypothetical protein